MKLLILATIIAAAAARGSWLWPLYSPKTPTCSAVWNVPACHNSEPCHTCGQRVEYLLTQGFSNVSAQEKVAREFPQDCGACNATCSDAWSTAVCDGEGCPTCGQRLFQLARSMNFGDAMWETALEHPTKCLPCDEGRETEGLSWRCSRRTACGRDGCHSCGKRIELLKKRYGYSSTAAAMQVAVDFPRRCKACNPSCRAAWNVDACAWGGCYTCGARIAWVRSQGRSLAAARASVTAEFPEKCMPCFTNSPPRRRTFRKLVWSDEFHGTHLDEQKWDYDLGAGRWGNHELQTYTKEAVTVSGGTLKITAQSNNGTMESARVVTRGRADWSRGRFEVRAKVPLARGTWPAIWMLPTNNTYGTWPLSGEIDIMEHVGGTPGRVHAGVHNNEHHASRSVSACAADQTTDGLGDCFVRPPVEKFEDEFHVYAMEWTDEGLLFFVDGWFYSMYPRVEGADWKTWPFDERFHLIINFAVGGTWGGINGVDFPSFPLTFEIDYVRVYQ